MTSVLSFYPDQASDVKPHRITDPDRLASVLGNLHPGLVARLDRTVLPTIPVFEKTMWSAFLAYGDAWMIDDNYKLLEAFSDALESGELG